MLWNKQIDLPSIPTGYINAGGRGSRLSELFTSDSRTGVAKALLEVGEPPIPLIDHHVATMARAAFANIIIHAGDQTVVAEYVRDTYRPSDGVHVLTSEERLGNGGDLQRSVALYPELFSRALVISNVDTIVDIDLVDFASHHQKSPAAMTIALTQLPDVPNHNAFSIDQYGRVLHSRESSPAALTARQSKRVAWQASSTGVVAIDTQFVRKHVQAPRDGSEFSLYRQVLAQALAKRALGAYDNASRFFLDVGTVENWIHAEQTGSLQPHLCYDGATRHESATVTEA
jgi:NDP-sugar pyrophosphorylase family protein